MDTESTKMTVPWKIFNRAPNAPTIAAGLDILPPSWELTPLRDKRPFRKNWQTEPPVSREFIKDGILNWQEFKSEKTGNYYKAYSSGYGLRTGEISGGLIAIDVDGLSAHPILDALSSGELPTTVSWASGKPGRKQLLFQIPEEYRGTLKNFTRKVIYKYGEVESTYVIEDGEKVYKEGLEFRYNEHQSALPPSRHPDTGEYFWINSPTEFEVAIAPGWLCKLLVEYATQEREKTQEKQEREFSYTDLRTSYQSTGTASNIFEFLEFEVLPRLAWYQIYYHPVHNFKERGKDQFVGNPPFRASSSGTSFQVGWNGSAWVWHDKGSGEGGGAIQYRWMLRGGTGTPTGKDYVEIVEELAYNAGLELPNFKKDYKYENNSRINARKSRTSDHDTRENKSTVPGMDNTGFGAGNSKSNTATGRSQTSINYENYGFILKPDLIVNRRYLGSISSPQSGILGIKAGKGTGKTETAQPIVQDAVSIGRPVILLTHRIQLGRNLCVDRFGLYWTDDKDESAVPGLHIGLCVDSLWKLNPDNYKNGIIVIDEIEQVIWHLLNSSTCKEKRTRLLKCFKQLIATVIGSGGLVIGMDADLSQNTLGYLVAMSEQEIKPFVCVNEWKPDLKYIAECLVSKVYVLKQAILSGSCLSLKYFLTNLIKVQIPKIVMYDFSNPARMIREIESCLEKGEKLYICCDSRDGRYSAKGLTDLLCTKFPSLKILCVDAETSRTPGHPAMGFIDNINQDIKNFDVVICSPSIGSGVSIDVKGHFNKVFGIFNGVIPEWEARQALARVRENVPRLVWGKSVGMGSVYRTAKLTNHEEIIKKLTEDFTKNSKLTELFVPSTDIEKIMQGYHDPAHLIAFSQTAAKVNKSMWNYRESLHRGLRSEGYQIEIVSDKELENKIWSVMLQRMQSSSQDDNELWELELSLRQELLSRQEPDKAIVKYLGGTSKKRKQETYTLISNQKLLNKDEANKLNYKKVRTTEEDYQLEKYNLSQMYSGAEITPGLVQKTKADSYHSKIQRHYFLQAPVRYAQLLDRKQLASQISSGGNFYLPDLKNLSLETEILSSFNLMQWVNPDIEINSKSESLLAWCEGLLSQYQEIQLRLGINLKPHIPDKDSKERIIDSIGMLQTMLDYIGLRYICSRRPKLPDGSRIRFYKLDTEVLSDERVDIFSRWDKKYSEYEAEHQAEPVTLPWSEMENGGEKIPKSDSRPRNSYRYKQTNQDVDAKPVDAETKVPTNIWKGVVTRVKDSLTGINVIWQGIYEKFCGQDCTVDTEPYPVNVEGGIQWQVWASFAPGIYKAIPCAWLECVG